MKNNNSVVNMFVKEKNKRYLNSKTKTMKPYFLTIILFFSSFALTVAQEKETVNLTIEVTATKYNKGQVLLALYHNKNEYMKKSYKSSMVMVENGKALIQFDKLEKGEYAFSLFHDLNNNKKLDSNLFGIPKEPYAFSNNRRGRFGPPSYEKVKFNITHNQHIKVSIK